MDDAKIVYEEHVMNTTRYGVRQFTHQNRYEIDWQWDGFHVKVCRSEYVMLRILQVRDGDSMYTSDVMHFNKLISRNIIYYEVFRFP